MEISTSEGAGSVVGRLGGFGVLYVNECLWTMFYSFALYLASYLFPKTLFFNFFYWFGLVLDAATCSALLSTALFWRWSHSHLLPNAHVT